MGSPGPCGTGGTGPRSLAWLDAEPEASACSAEEDATEERWSGNGEGWCDLETAEEKGGAAGVPRVPLEGWSRMLACVAARISATRKKGSIMKYI